MTTYRRKPTTCEAWQWDGDYDAVIEFLVPQAADVYGDGELAFRVIKSQSSARIPLGDWIIREADGSGFYPCAADVFAATYEPVS